MPERRYSGVEVRAEGRTLTGPAMRYGDVSPSHRERFEPGAFLLDGKTRWLDVRHDRNRVIAWTEGGGLELTDTREALMVRAVLPAIPLADVALADVRSGNLAGFSIEFNASEERRESGIRVISKSELSGIGLVGKPSYTQSKLELRARSGRTMRAVIPANRNVACRCSGVQCKFARIMGDAMESIFDEFKKGSSREMVAAFGSYDAALASVSSGTLRGRLLRNGDGEISIDIPEGAVGTATIAANDSAGVIVRPVLDLQDSESHLEGDVRVYTGSTKARAWIVAATDQREGWPSAGADRHARRISKSRIPTRRAEGECWL